MISTNENNKISTEIIIPVCKTKSLLVTIKKNEQTIDENKK